MSAKYTGYQLRKNNRPKFLNAGLAVQEYVRRISLESVKIVDLGKKFGLEHNEMRHILDAYYGHSSKPVEVSFSIETNKDQYERALEREIGMIYIEAAAELLRFHPEFNEPYYLANPQNIQRHEESLYRGTDF